MNIVASPISPLGQMALLLVLAATTYTTYRVLCMLLDRSVEIVEGALYLAVLLGFAGAIVTTWHTRLGPLLALLLLLLCLGGVAMEKRANALAIKRMDEEDLRELEALMKRLPGNVAPVEKAVKVCRRRGEYQRAIAYIDAYLQVVGADKRMETLLERLKRMVRLQRTGAKVCPECDFENFAGAATCAHCGRNLALPTDIFAVFMTDTGQKALVSAGVTLLVVAIILATVRMSLLVVAAVFVSAFALLFAYFVLRR